MADPLDQLRRLCLALAEATEKEAWGDPTFRVRDKIFVMTPIEPSTTRRTRMTGRRTPAPGRKTLRV